MHLCPGSEPTFSCVYVWYVNMRDKAFDIQMRPGDWAACDDGDAWRLTIYADTVNV
jgi:hypothetical protein